MNIEVDASELIHRPDGSAIHPNKLEPAKLFEHELVMHLCHDAEVMQRRLRQLKRLAVQEMQEARQTLLDAYEVKKGGKGGNLSLRSQCGRYMVRLSISKHVTFGPELEAAKALIGEVVQDELAKGASTFIANIVARVFSLNKAGRIDTQGVLNLRNVVCDDPRWARAMEAIEKAILRDSETTYINFYTVDPKAEPKSSGEKRISLNLAEL